jgi:electron transport complex protein RnfD
MLSDIRVSCAPHISQRLSTRVVMIDVIIALIPAMAAAGYYFRFHALILISTCVISAVATERFCNLIRKQPNSLGDFSAVVTGIILALSLPPALPFWAAAIGSCFAIAIGKMVFGGLGSNIFNPAMVGRAFLTASFGMLMTTWTVPATVDATMSKISPENKIDARTQATPLAWSKQAIKNEKEAKSLAKAITESQENAEVYAKAKVTAETKSEEEKWAGAYAETMAEVEKQTKAYANLKAEAEKYIQILNEQLKPTFIGEVGGCLGETSAIALLIGALYLFIRRTITLHIPLAVILSAFIFAVVAYLINSDAYVQPFFHLTSGGMLLGAFFIATDPVTAPLTRRGMWLFGIGVGTITMLIRIVGEYPEGMMFSVLLMNGMTPLIDRLCKRIPAGGKPHV